MDFQTIFNEYYTLYRGDSDVPTSTDPEWSVAIRLANNAIRRWKSVDGVLWNELFTTRSEAGTGDSALVTGQTAYAAATDMDEPGGFVKFTHPSNGSFTNYELVAPEQIQNLSPLSPAAYFLGDPSTGYTLNVHPSPVADLNGYTIDYAYYRKPTFFESDEDGTTKAPMSDPYFIVHDMLANRFRASRNWTAYQIARRDADESLKNMIIQNNGVSPFNTWTVKDSSGVGFGY